MSIPDLLWNLSIETKKSEKNLDNLSKKSKESEKSIQKELSNTQTKINEISKDRILSSKSYADEEIKNLNKINEKLKNIKKSAKEARRESGAGLSSDVAGMNLRQGITSAIKRILPLIAVGGVAAAVSKITSTRAEEGAALNQQAWRGGSSAYAMTTQRIKGERLGIDKNEVDSSLSAFADKIKSALMDRATNMTGIMGEDSKAFSKLGISLTNSKGQANDLSKILDQVIAKQRKMVETGASTQEMAIARLTQQFGLSFDMASKYINATTQEIAAMNEGLAKEAISRTALMVQGRAMEMSQKKQAVAQQLVGDAIAKETVPAMTRLYDSLTKATSSGFSMAKAIGTMAAAMIDFTAKAVGAVSEFFESNKKARFVVAEARSRANEIYKTENEAGRIQGAIIGNTGLTFSQLQNKLKEDIEKEIAEGKLFIDGKSKEEVAKESEDLAKDAITIGANTKQVNELLEKLNAGDIDNDKFTEMLGKLVDINKSTLGAQHEANRELKQIGVNTTPVSLEQALSLWAGGVGKAAGFGTTSGFEGNSRAKYEEQFKKNRAGLAMTGIPFSGESITERRNAGMSSFAAINQAASGYSSMIAGANSEKSVSSVNTANSSVGAININVNGDSKEIAANVGGEIKKNLRNLVYTFSDARVS